jgi:histidyl-tRNA synthetase
MGHKTGVKMTNDLPYMMKDLDKSSEIAMFYGFKPVKSPRISKEDTAKALDLYDEKKYSVNKSEIFPRLEEKISLFRTYLEWNLADLRHPAMVYYRRPLGGSSEKKPANEHHFGLDIVGSVSSICEAIALKTAHAILTDYGHKDLIVDINSIGDKDSTSRFESELSTYIRKHIESVPGELRSIFRKNPFEAITSTHEAWAPLKERMPQPMSSLSDGSIANFKETLEHLEMLEIPYRVTHDLIGNRSYCSHTIFEIKSSTDASDSVFAIGTRHNHLSKKIGFKKDIPVMSLNLRFKKPEVEPKLFPKNKLKPRFYFIQFGSKAKLKSLAVIENLRQARIPVHHSLTHDQFVDQMSSAEKAGSPFLIIIGQKEAMENTAVVRHVSTRVQETIPIKDLALYLDKLK